jgi:multisubunit Na+/H+ antiporter MnhC subunit
MMFTFIVLGIACTAVALGVLANLRLDRIDKRLGIDSQGWTEAQYLARNADPTRP